MKKKYRVVNWCDYNQALKKGKKYQRRKWRKIHIGVDEKGNVRALEMTNHKTNDRQMAKPIMESIGFDNISEMIGDGGYDSLEIYSELQKRGIQTEVVPSFLHHPMQKYTKNEMIYVKGMTQSNT